MPPVKKYEPVLQYRYIVAISKLGTLEQGSVGIYVAKSIELPKISYEEVEIDQKGASFKAKGKVRYQDVQMTLYTDPLTHKTISSEWMVKHQDPNDVNEKKSNEYVDTVTIKIQAPDGSTIGTWKLHEAFIGEVDFGTMDWESSEVAEVSLTIRYDYATYS